VSRAVLSLNAGSSSIKFGLFELDGDGGAFATAAGKIEGIGTSPHLEARDASGVLLSEQRWGGGAALPHEAFLETLLNWAEAHLGSKELVGVGHRVVHGGLQFTGPAVLSDSVVDEIEALTPLAPLHQPHNLAAIRAIRSVRPRLPQVACFDTAFHRTQPAVAMRFALPRELGRQGIRRYGFHGISYEYVSRTLLKVTPELASARVIVAHLGNGASLCAMRGGLSVDTTMGFTALDGLVMGTRCGSIDPGVLLYLLQQKGLTAEDVQRLLYEQSGLLGVSGLSSDMRVLLDSDDPRADEAIELFAYRVAREAGALAASLGGVDAFVFTAGIGEGAASVRALIAERLAWLGVKIDAAANAAGEGVVSAPDSAVLLRVMHTDEELMIALHTIELLLAAAA